MSRCLVSVLAGDEREVALYKPEVGFLASSVGAYIFDFTGGCCRVLVSAMFIDSDFELCFLLKRVWLILLAELAIALFFVSLIDFAWWRVMLVSCGGGLGFTYRKYAAFVADLLLTVSSCWSLIERLFVLMSVRPACSSIFYRLIVPDILAR